MSRLLIYFELNFEPGVPLSTASNVVFCLRLSSGLSTMCGGGCCFLCWCWRLLAWFQMSVLFSDLVSLFLGWCSLSPKSWHQHSLWNWKACTLQLCVPFTTLLWIFRVPAIPHECEHHTFILKRRSLEFHQGSHQVYGTVWLGFPSWS